MAAQMDIYLRVSKKGDREGDEYKSPAIQEAAARQWATLHGVEVARTPVFDEDVSGGRAVQDRQLEELIARVERGDSDGIIVYRVDRFARNLVEAGLAWERIKDANGRLVAVADGLDSDNDGSKVYFQLLSMFAEWYLDGVKKGFVAALDRAVTHEGKHIASRAPLGYLREDQVPGGPKRSAKLVPDPATADAVREAFMLRAGGASHGDVVEFLRGKLKGTGRENIAKSGVTGMLRNRVYLGEARGPGRTNSKGQTIPDSAPVKKNAHEALVDEATWDKVQARAGSRAPRKDGTTGQALLGGLITCASCGHKLRTIGSPQGGPSYVCASKYAGGDCEAPAAARVKLVDEWVAQQLAGAWDEVTAGAQSAEQRYVAARERVQKLEAELDEWVNDPDMALALGTAKYKQGVMERNERLKTAKRELAELDNTLPADARVVTIDGQPWVYETWGDDPDRDRALVRSVIAEIKLEKADPKRRRWQPIEERVQLKWVGQAQ